MGNKNSCCAYSSPQSDRKSKDIPPVFEERHQLPHTSQHQLDGHHGTGGVAMSVHHHQQHLQQGNSNTDNFENQHNLQHISEREALEGEEDPSVDPTAATMFLERSKVENGGMSRKRSQHQIAQQNSSIGGGGGGGGGSNTPGANSSGGGITGGGGLKKSSSCSTIYLDDSTVSQPNLKNTVKCVSLAIYYHIKNRQSDRRLDIFDEKLHPLTHDHVPDNYDTLNPEHRQIYKFVRTLFNAAQLTAECAIITLVYLERLLTYAELDVGPCNWKRMVLGMSKPKRIIDL